ncbi:MAG: NAD(P)-binding protein, partial [Acidimicrobiales bacterium]|nr:NAD(P)-binding protein [Acidimicrobiales bacterium]
MPSVRIVGAGVAGCAAAATALELGYQVTVYEAGPGHPLPPALRSPDLNRARSAHRWWWPHSYLAGRGLGGSSAVNGMVLQMPLEPSPEATWAWMALDPAHAEPGPLAVRLGEASTTARFEPTWLALASG